MESRSRRSPPRGQALPGGVGGATMLEKKPSMCLAAPSATPRKPSNASFMALVISRVWSFSRSASPTLASNAGLASVPRISMGTVMPPPMAAGITNSGLFLR